MNVLLEGQISIIFHRGRAKFHRARLPILFTHLIFADYFPGITILDCEDIIEEQAAATFG